MPNVPDQVFPIEILPPRKRKDDIVPLAEFILRRYAHHHRPELARSAAELLRKHPWYGNVRELRSCIERAALVCNGRTITAHHLRPLLDDHSSPYERDLLPMADVERRAILDALAQCGGGNRTQAAAALGIGRRTLQKKLERCRDPAGGNVAAAALESLRVRSV